MDHLEPLSISLILYTQKELLLEYFHQYVLYSAKEKQIKSFHDQLNHKVQSFKKSIPLLIVPE